MTRLTNDIRESISRRCIETQFKASVEKLKKEEHALGMKLYREAFDSKTRAAALKLSKGWLRMDSCLRFNCGGFDLTLSVNEPVPVPYSTNCSRLGNITGDLATAAQEYAQRKEEARSQHSAAKNKLMAMLGAISSVKQLEKTWPEGRPFYERYLAVKEGASLPAVQVADLNKILGLKQAA